MIRIESSSNTIFKNTKKLLTTSGRKKSGLFILEGERLVADSVKSGANIEYFLLSESFDSSKMELPDRIKTYVLSDKLFSELKSTVNSQGVMAVSSYEPHPLSELDLVKGTYLYLDSVADPGNMGTIIRSANAFGIDGVILSKGCSDVFSPKVLRSTMSGIFSVKLSFDDGSALKTLRERGFKIVGTFPKGEFSSSDFDYTDRCVIVMGNEANGICEKTELEITDRVTIPMEEGAESLNVSVACGIMLYEVYNHRN